MFKKLIAKIKEAAAKAREPAVPPEELFDDPLAARTKWTPVKPGGANFRTHKLVRVDLKKMKFRLTFGAFLFCFIFAAFGVGAFVFWLINLVSLLSGGDGEWNLVWFLAIFWLAFGGAGFGMYYAMSKPRIFCKRVGYYWKGRTSPDAMMPADRDALTDNFIELDDIHALQLISEYCGGESSYYSYELNLVRQDGSRVNVIDHGSRKKILADAEQLAEFLDVPLWDCT